MIKAEDRVITAAGAHMLQSHSLITHQTTQHWNHLKITAGTQQDKSAIRQLCGGNNTRGGLSPVNTAPGWLLERVFLTVSSEMEFSCWAKTGELHFWGPSAHTAPCEMDAGEQSDSMLRTAVITALLDAWKKLIQPFPASFQDCGIKWDGGWVGTSPHRLSLPFRKGSL